MVIAYKKMQEEEAEKARLKKIQAKKMLAEITESNKRAILVKK